MSGENPLESKVVGDAGECGWIGGQADRLEWRSIRSVASDELFAQVQRFGRAAPVSTGENHLAIGERIAGALNDCLNSALKSRKRGERALSLLESKSKALLRSPCERWHHHSLVRVNQRNITQPDVIGNEAQGDRSRRVIAVTGSTGTVGSALCESLRGGGHRVIQLVRQLVRGESSPARDQVRWNPMGSWDAASLEGIDAVVHLAGENIASGRWTPQRKRAIMESRAVGTRCLCEVIARLAKPPAVFVCASGVGYYGDRQPPKVDESAGPGSGFLAAVTKEWEAALVPVEQGGIRTVRMRIGVVVSAHGGVIARLRLPFLLCAGGPVGSGRQGMSWIHLDDLTAAIQFVIERDSIRGPVNAVAPGALSQREFARALARVLRRPSVAPFPAPLVRLIFGEMGSELLLQGQFVEPAVLLRSGFRFNYPTIDGALQFELGRGAP